jgi:hypothetical protein
VREFREAVTLLHSGECRGRRKLAEILGEERWEQGECMLGHRKSSTSDIYALRNPAQPWRRAEGDRVDPRQYRKAMCWRVYRTVTAVA